MRHVALNDHSHVSQCPGGSVPVELASFLPSLAHSTHRTSSGFGLVKLDFQWLREPIINSLSAAGIAKVVYVWTALPRFAVLKQLY